VAMLLKIRMESTQRNLKFNNETITGFPGADPADYEELFSVDTGSIYMTVIIAFSCPKMSISLSL